jgi:hypothetical protein
VRSALILEVSEIFLSFRLLMNCMG